MATEQCSYQPVVTVEDGQGLLLAFHANQEHRVNSTAAKALLQMVMDRLNFRDSMSRKVACTDPFHDVDQPHTVIRDFVPWRTGGQAHTVNVLAVQFHLPPGGIRRQFAPGSPVTSEQKLAPECVFRLVIEIGLQNDSFKSFPIIVKFRMVELAPQELGDNLCFPNWPQLSQTVSLDRKDIQAALLGTGRADCYLSTPGSSAMSAAPLALFI